MRMRLLLPSDAGTPGAGILPVVPDSTEASGDTLGQARSVGIVGAGQLARMTCESASALGIPTVVLAEHPGDAATGVAPEIVVGAPTVEKELRLLAERCDVLTFDHEQIDLGLLAILQAEGTTVRPGLGTLEMAVDKARMRVRLAEAGVPVPAFAILTGPGAGEGIARDDSAGAGDGAGEPRGDVERTLSAVTVFTATRGWPVVLKAARGGYDGKGVWPVDDLDQAEEVCRRAAAAGIPLLVEELVAIDVELAVLVARRADGQVVAWPAVETAQVDGMCREVLVPGRLDQEVAAAADVLARQVAEVAGSVGVLAVELFCSGGQLLVNEVAARPHNSGHWTIEGAVTSQFENHLRAVLDLPLGTTEPTAPHVASVNVLGAEDGTDPAARLPAALAVPGAHVHLYGKETRPGRKLGHVTVCGTEAGDVRARAWAAARALGTPVPLGIELPGDGVPGGRS
jgi:5-(carboxyamino)imidazole ribonucleotide synthase